ncbi:hypothetical protein ATO10_01165 [Actibacterium atlanticum]|uniref:Uncharacterized protein n=1 Tax=Actibacterium atlanticum TaxID=1461693 RepID=A0A058ZP49_9RHOB|nr:hypothetical protein ATO10_01165 [Actibacterium atlanticum]
MKRPRILCKAIGLRIHRKIKLYTILRTKFLRRSKTSDNFLRISETTPLVAAKNLSLSRCSTAC